VGAFSALITAPRHVHCIPPCPSSAVPARLGLKAPALAWPEGASAFQNPRPSPRSRLRLGHGLAWPRPGLLQQIPGRCPLLLPRESTHTSTDVGVRAREVERHCLGWGAASSSFMGSSSSDRVCVQGWRAPCHLRLQTPPPTFTVCWCCSPCMRVVRLLFIVHIPSHPHCSGSLWVDR
jgi:hypothetical protein